MSDSEPLNEIGQRYFYSIEAESSPKYHCKCGNKRLFKRIAVSREIWLLDNQGEFREVLNAFSKEMKRVRCFFCSAIVKPAKEMADNG